MSIDSLTKAITNMPGKLFALAVVFLSVALAGFTRLAYRQERFGLHDIQIPDYGLAIGIMLVLFGILDTKFRGVIVTCAGTATVAISAVALLALETGRWDVFLFALPLTAVGAAGLGMLSHGVLHASPGDARLGFKILVFGSVASFAAGLVGLPYLAWRLAIHGTDEGTTNLILGSVATLVVGVVVLIVGVRQGKADRDDASVT